MSRPRNRLDKRYLTIIVEPAPDFAPTNWRQTPEHYKIIEVVGPRKFRGSVDAWKFLHNHNALTKNKTGRWAIFLDLDQSAFQPLGHFGKPAPKAVPNLPENRLVAGNTDLRVIV